MALSTIRSRGLMRISGMGTTLLQGSSQPPAPVEIPDDWSVR
jgi:hypothetical protein